MVTVYTLPNCVQCDQTKRILDKLEVAYETVDLSEDVEAATKMIELGYKQAPVVMVDETHHWSGFRLDKLTNLKPIHPRG